MQTYFSDRHGFINLALDFGSTVVPPHLYRFYEFLSHMTQSIFPNTNFPKDFTINFSRYLLF